MNKIDIRHNHLNFYSVLRNNEEVATFQQEKSHSTSDNARITIKVPDLKTLDVPELMEMVHAICNYIARTFRNTESIIVCLGIGRFEVDLCKECGHPHVRI